MPQRPPASDPPKKGLPRPDTSQGEALAFRNRRCCSSTNQRSQEAEACWQPALGSARGRAPHRQGGALRGEVGEAAAVPHGSGRERAALQRGQHYAPAPNSSSPGAAGRGQHAAGVATAVQACSRRLTAVVQLQCRHDEGVAGLCHELCVLEDGLPLVARVRQGVANQAEVPAAKRRPHPGVCVGPCPLPH